MATMLGFCGLDCAHCGAFLATQADDDEMRAATAREWSERYNADIPPDTINCTGCRGDGVKFSYCEHMCEIRKCGVGKGVETCAACNDYACARLEGFLQAAPEAREALEALRK